MLRLLLPPLVSGVLLYLCYFPADCGWLAWVALVPLLTLVRSPARPWKVYLAAFAGGLVCYWPALQWLRVADPRMYFTWAFLATYCALYFPLGLFLVRLLDRRAGLPLVVAVPVTWTALEMFRCWFGTGFSWYLLGHTQHDVPPLLQVADLAGASGLTFLVAAVNGLLADLLLARPWFRSLLGTMTGGTPVPQSTGGTPVPQACRSCQLLQGVAVLLLLLGAFAYGSWRLRQNDFTPGPRVALVQGNLDQRIRNESSVAEGAAMQMLHHYEDLADLAATCRPDVIVWPETSLPFDWVETAPGQPSEATRDFALRCVLRWKTSNLLGMNSAVGRADGSQRRYNSAVLVDAAGQPTGRYDKIHCVPFGEYVPLRDWLPFMNRFAPYDFDYSVWPGEQFTRFQLTNPSGGTPFTFGVVICYEDTDAMLSRPYAGSDTGPPADFLLNISNDGWFNGTSEHDQHLAICRFRAVECRRTVARSVNMGISAIIDGNGRVLAPRRQELSPEAAALCARTAALRGEQSASVLADARVWETPADMGELRALPVSQWGEYKKVPGVLLATLPVDHRTSLYARLGDWLPWSCWGVLLAALLLGFVRGRAGRTVENVA